MVRIPANIAALYEKLVQFYIVGHLLYRLLQLEQVQIDWMGLIENIQKHIENGEVSSPQPYLIFMGEVAQSRLEDKQLAADHFEKALDLGTVETKIYDFLNEYYASVNQPVLRDKVLKHQLINASDGQRVPILRTSILLKTFPIRSLIATVS